ncbi:DNA-3-methyladenine glycosylase [Niallia oryzisoli]|uniref:Putative 3-methyladenine DNA glycosylase n=1 Tax=Niallia oryzisoli TaxID=1737571 RepID=A0ABZ2CBS7_9BACI
MTELKPLSIDFFQQPTLELAQNLLGCLLVKETEEGIASGYIVETEAYIGPGDRASHGFGNRRTKRTEILFGEAGYVYTFVTHTHTLVNVVSGPAEESEGILVRAIEPVEGIDLMRERRGIDNLRNLTNGPGKLTKALKIKMDDYGLPITKPPLYITTGKIPEAISKGPRVGIENSGEAKHYPWRFWITGNPFVSRKG